MPASRSEWDHPRVRQGRCAEDGQGNLLRPFHCNLFRLPLGGVGSARTCSATTSTAGRSARFVRYMERAEETDDGRAVNRDEKEEVIATASNIGPSTEERALFFGAAEEFERENNRRGKAARVQSRLTFELPADMSAEGAARVLESVGGKLGARGWMWSGAVHAPPNPDKGNLHVHVAWHDRRGRWNPDAEFGWEFELTKDPEAHEGKSFVRRMRQEVAEAVNAEAEREGIVWRWTPGTYRSIGVDRPGKKRVPAGRAWRKAGERSWSETYNDLIDQGRFAEAEAMKGQIGESKRREAAAQRQAREVRAAEKAARREAKVRKAGFVPAAEVQRAAPAPRPPKPPSAVQIDLVTDVFRRLRRELPADWWTSPTTEAEVWATVRAELKARKAGESGSPAHRVYELPAEGPLLVAEERLRTKVMDALVRTSDADLARLATTTYAQMQTGTQTTREAAKKGAALIENEASTRGIDLATARLSLTARQAPTAGLSVTAVTATPTPAKPAPMLKIKTKDLGR